MKRFFGKRALVIAVLACVGLVVLGSLGARLIWTRPIRRAEGELRKLARQKDGPREIFALLTEGTWGGVGQRYVLLFNDRTVLRCDDGNGRSRERMLSATELNELRSWIATNKIDQLRKFDEFAADGIQYEYVHITPNGAEHRVFMNNPPGAPVDGAAFFPGGNNQPNRLIYGELTRRLLSLEEKPMPVSYKSLENLPGFKVVHAKEQREVSGLRYIDHRLAAGIVLPDHGEIAWHPVTEAGISPEVVITGGRRSRRGFYDLQNVILITTGPLTGKHLLVVWDADKRGLWMENESSDRQVIATGLFGREPVVTPDGNWIVAAKTPDDHMWDVPNGVVRIHIRSKRIFPVDLPPADNFDPLAWLSAHEKVLLSRHRDREQFKAGPARPEFYLLDAATGEHRKVTGDFRPLVQAGGGYQLQPCRSRDRVWAAVPDWENENGGTAIGQYDMKSFEFSPVEEMPGIKFSSNDMWVDEATQVVWVAANGDLLRFNLPE